MRLVDLSREIYHKEPTNPRSLPPQVWPWTTHEGTRSLYTTGYSSANCLLTFLDHTSTRVDAPRHFDSSPTAPDIASTPLSRFFGPALCLDVSETRRPTWIDADDIAAACERHKRTVNKGDIVLLLTGHYRRTYPRPEFFTAYPGMTPDAAHWLHERGVGNFGVEGPNPGHPSDTNFEVHLICRETGMIHMEGLMNLEELAGRRFTFCGFPLKIRSGSGSPIRAVAFLDD